MNILMVGPLPPPVGGISVSFRIMVKLLQPRRDIAIQVVDFSSIRNRHRSYALAFIHLVRAAWAAARTSDVLTLSCASTALPSLGLLMLGLSRLFNKPLIIRKAAGLDYMAIGRLTGAIAHFVIKRADLYLAQTRYLQNLARQRGLTDVEWFPTNRPLLKQETAPRIAERRCRRFIFIGQVRQHKGILELIAAAERFEVDVTVDVFGPVFDDINPSIFAEHRRVRYAGALSPDDVLDTLVQYDIFLLPSKHAPEGYPGAIIEAFSAGLPVITTRSGGIPEIVDETCGVFVEPGDANDLYLAMKRVVEDDGFYRQLLQGVAQKRKEFDSAVWAERFVDYCRRVVAARSAPAPLRNDGAAA